jgi:hypothetical protein
MKAPTWVYHRTEEAKIVDKCEAEILYHQGWADSPARFKESPPDKEAPVLSDDDDESTAIVDMDKAKLVEYAWNNIPPEHRQGITKRDKKEVILKTVNEFLNKTV